MFKKGQILKIVDVDMLHLPFSTMFEKGDLFEALEDSDGVGLRVKHLRTGAEGWWVEYRFVEAPFQIGDRVIREKNDYGHWCTEDEIKAIPRERHPHEVYEYQPGDRAGLDLMPIKVIYNDPATIFFYKDPISGEPTKSVAKCHPNDTYDKNKGRRVAVLKALHKEIPRIIKHETK